MQKILGIKQEKNEESAEYQIEDVEDAHNSTTAHNKQKLLEAFGLLKAENQKLTFDLKEKQDECSKIVSEKNKMAENVATAQARIRNLELELTDIKQKFEKQNDEYEQKLSNVSHENQHLTARLKQLQTGLDTHQAATNQNLPKTDDKICEENDYEVEAILHDKMKGNVHFFLIRWKGFSAEYDTWERKSNLNCPSILKNYFKTKNK